MQKKIFSERMSAAGGGGTIFSISAAAIDSAENIFFFSGGVLFGTFVCVAQVGARVYLERWKLITDLAPSSRESLLLKNQFFCWKKTFSKEIIH